jgi:hypothetical protein
MSMKNSNDTIGNRTRDLQVCSAVPQPTAPCVPQWSYLETKSQLAWKLASKSLVRTIVILLRHFREAKQSTETGMLRDNGSDSYNSYWCNGGARWPPSAGCRVIQGAAISAAHRLWSLWFWSYLHPQQGHSCILTRIQKSDPILNMRVDVIKPVFNLEPKYRVTMLAREEWTRGPGLKGSSGLRMGPGLRRGTGWGCMGSL